MTWEDGAPEHFKERRRKKWPLTETTGFSVLGLMVNNCSVLSWSRGSLKGGVAKSEDRSTEGMVQGVKVLTRVRSVSM